MNFPNFYRYNFLKAALFTGCFFVSSCENSPEDFNKLTSKRIGIEVAKDVKILYSIGNETKSRITAPLMLRHQELVPYIEFTKTIHADFFDDSMRIESRLDAHYAKYMETESKVFLKDSVVVINTKGDTLYCKELYWDRRRTGEEFYTDKPVRIRTKTEILDGDGLDAPQDFHNWHLINGRGIVRVSSSEFPQ
ncbi:MAG: LPS export ABC transporter periplasmic protein LptC [Ginsengibacter sp.]